MNQEVELLSRIRVVLVATRHPGNIGSAARAMRNMGLSDLALVDPHRFPDPEATALASGADSILEGATLYPTLADAVADCEHVIATTARVRYVQIPFSEPRECVARLAAGEHPGRVAIVFGRERTGLFNEELDHCREAVAIPTDPEFGSMNLAINHGHAMRSIFGCSLVTHFVPLLVAIVAEGKPTFCHSEKPPPKYCAALPMAHNAAVIPWLTS